MGGQTRKGYLVIHEGGATHEFVVTDKRPDLYALQKLVKGDIEFLALDLPVTCYANAEAKYEGLKPTLTTPETIPGDKVCGPVVFLGTTDDEGNERLLSEDMVSVILAHVTLLGK